MPTVFALADDLTGALEAGAKFAGCGIPSRVTVFQSGADDLLQVIDTETRHLTPAEAARRVAALVDPDTQLVYLKTDSTLRGNIAAELRALASAMPGASIAYIPAYPALGRTVKDGCLFVDGIPVHQTDFAGDPMNPVHESSIPGLLGADLPCVIYDGETDAEVGDAVEAALRDGRFRIIAGPASVAAELAARIDLPRRDSGGWPVVKRCLIVNGSLNPRSAQQIEYSLAHGCASPDDTADWRVLRISGAAADLGRATLHELERGSGRALMIFGGDTAFCILKELGWPALEPIGEVIAGVPVSRVAGQDLHLITKAGGFGDQRVICRLKHILHANREH